MSGRGRGRKPAAKLSPKPAAVPPASSTDKLNADIENAKQLLIAQGYSVADREIAKAIIHRERQYRDQCFTIARLEDEIKTLTKQLDAEKAEAASRRADLLERCLSYYESRQKLQKTYDLLRTHVTPALGNAPRLMEILQQQDSVNEEFIRRNRYLLEGMAREQEDYRKAEEAAAIDTEYDSIINGTHQLSEEDKQLPKLTIEQLAALPDKEMMVALSKGRLRPYTDDELQ